MPPAVVIFDMDDVLCRYDLGARLRALSQISGKTPRDIRAAIWDSGFEDAADAGQYQDADAYLAEFGRRLGYPLTAAQWVAARRQSMTAWPDTLAIAKAIGAQARLALFTNNGPLARRHLDELFPEVTAIFPERYYSFEFATKKPDPASYGKLMARMDAAPATAWFIDDKRSNVEGAKLAGLDGHLFRSAARLEEAARQRGLLP